MAWKGKFEGQLAERASKPNHRSDIRREYYGQFKASDVRIDNKALQLAYHHITDWAKLREVWNRMVEDKHFGTICCWLYAVGFDTSSVFVDTFNDEPVVDGRQTPAAITMAIKNGEQVERVADVGEIHERVTWSTWNLVEGPEGAIRTDDRGNFHDIFSTVRTGLSVSERTDLQAADRIYSAMAALNLKAPVPKERALALSNAFLGVNRTATIIKFRPEMWIHNPKAGKKAWTKDLV